MFVLLWKACRATIILISLIDGSFISCPKGTVNYLLRHVWWKFEYAKMRCCDGSRRCHDLWRLGACGVLARSYLPMEKYMLSHIMNYAGISLKHRAR